MLEAEALETQLTLEILSGKGPDLVIWDGLYTPALASEKLMADLNGFMDADPDFSPHAELFCDYLNREHTLRYMCGHCMDNFVDWNSGECRFDTPEFVELLELCRTLPDGFESIPESYSEAFGSGKIFWTQPLS